MQERIMIDHLATQKIDTGSVTYNFRDMRQVEDYIKAINYSYKGRCPIFSYWYGTLDNSYESFIESVNYLSKVYSKATGIRLRGVIADVYKNYLPVYNMSYFMIQIACKFAEYYLFQGYLTGVVIYDMGDYYRCHYFINPVSYWDGGKYRPNKEACLTKEEYILNNVMDYILNLSAVCDFSYLVAYPFI